MRAEARDPMVEEPRGWIALGAAGCHSLGECHSLREGMCCEERSSCDSQRAPSAKKVCDSQAHTQTQLCTTRTGTLTETHHKQCAAQRVTCVSTSAHVRAQPCLKFSVALAPTQRGFASLRTRSCACCLFHRILPVDDGCSRDGSAGSSGSRLRGGAQCDP